jgi:D-3-phosphoglycerate dehydrogenase / 2-oxoglutarate reductase
VSHSLVLALDRVGSDLEPETSILGPHGIEVRYPDAQPSKRRAELREAGGLLLNRTVVDERFLDAAPHCRVIATYGSGHDHIDLDAARASGVVVTNVPNYCTDEVADHTMAMLLALARGIPKGDAVVRAGGWGVEAVGELHRLSGQKLGLVGFGRIARAVAVRATAFGLRIATHDPSISDATIPSDVSRTRRLSDLLRAADWISLHAPLVPETRALINRHSLALMKDGSYLVNTSRGSLVDLPALLDALDSGHLAGVGLDVFPDEPPPPMAGRGRNLLLSPHSAYYSIESVLELKRAAATDVAAVLTGRPPASPLWS